MNETSLPSATGATPEALRAHLVYELGNAAGLQAGGWQARALAAVLRRPIDSIARMFSEVDVAIGRDGIAPAFAGLLERFVKDPRLAGVENLPAQGPLILASNHPGAYDALLIGATLGRRDFKLVSSTVPFFRAMTNFHERVIEVGTTPEEGMRSVRESARHLRDGGALLIFPSGLVDPDPDVLPGAREALATWRPGIEGLVNLAPQAAVVPVIASSMLSQRWINSPLLRLQRVDWQRRKLAEMAQVIQQMVWPRSETLSPRVTFGRAVCGEELQRQAGSRRVLPLLIAQAQGLLDEHLAAAEVHGPAAALAMA
jgi:hypothetical protein